MNRAGASGTLSFPAPAADLRARNGYRRFLFGVFRALALGFTLAALAALAITETPRLHDWLTGSTVRWIVAVLPFLTTIPFAGLFNRMPSRTLLLAFALQSLLFGLGLAAIFAGFGARAVELALFSTASLFAGLGLVSRLIPLPLSRLGVFLIGTPIASLVGLMLWAGLHAGTNQIALAAIAMGGFGLVTIVHLGCLKRAYFAHAGRQPLIRLQILGALVLFLDLLNLFQNAFWGAVAIAGDGD